MQAPENVAQGDRFKIALVITELEPGGAEKCLTELAVFLSARGHRVCVFALGPAPQGLRAVLVEQLRASGIEIQFGDARTMLDIWRAKYWLRQSLLEFQPDIVQSMLWHANVVSAIALRGKPLPLIGGVRVAEPKRFRWWVQRWLANRFHKIVCVSHDVARHCREKEGINPNKLLVIPNGISASSNGGAEKSWSELALPDSSRVILFVGRLEPQKGVEELIRHADEILSISPDRLLVLMGQGSLEHRLREIVRQLVHHDRIRFVGWQANAQHWMTAAELIVLPAIYEGMPNVLLEAMAVAKPLVAFAVDGVAELLNSNDRPDLSQNQIVEPGDWNQFAAKVARFSLDEALRNQIGQENQKHVQQHFLLHVQLGKYESLYKESVARH